MADRIRIEVETANGGHIVYVPQPDPTSYRYAQVRDIADQLVADAQALGVRDPAAGLLALLTEHTADARAYEREARRRGVLAL